MVFRSLGENLIYTFCLSYCSTMGTKLADYKTLGACIQSLVTSFLGHFDFEAVTEEGGNWGRIVLLIYLLVMIFLVVNIFITVINEALVDISPDDLPDDYKVTAAQMLT